MKLGDYAPLLSSPVAVRLLITLVSQLIALAGLFGVHTPFTSEQLGLVLDPLLTALAQIVALVFGALALKARKDAPEFPLTITTAAAEAKNAEKATDPVPPAQGGFARIGLLACLVVLSGCAMFGQLQPQGFSQQLVAAYSLVTTVRGTALTLLSARTITPDAAQSAQDKAWQARGLLDLADRLHTADASAGGGPLGRALVALGELQSCVDLKKPDFSRCVAVVEVPQS